MLTCALQFDDSLDDVIRSYAHTLIRSFKQAMQENCQNFVAAEGVELMILMVRAKNLSRYGALKVLDHAMSKGICPEIFTTFVEHAGLKSLFPAFMKAASIQTETRCSHQGGLVCQKKDCLSNIPRRGSGRKKKEIKKKNIVAAVLKGF